MSADSNRCSRLHAGLQYLGLLTVFRCYFCALLSLFKYKCMGIYHTPIVIIICQEYLVSDNYVCILTIHNVCKFPLFCTSG